MEHFIEKNCCWQFADILPSVIICLLPFFFFCTQFYLFWKVDQPLPSSESMTICPCAFDCRQSYWNIE